MAKKQLVNFIFEQFTKSGKFTREGAAQVSFFIKEPDTAVLNKVIKIDVNNPFIEDVNQHEESITDYLIELGSPDAIVIVVKKYYIEGSIDPQRGF